MFHCKFMQDECMGGNLFSPTGSTAEYSCRRNVLRPPSLGKTPASPPEPKGTGQRWSLDHWYDEQGIRPQLGSPPTLPEAFGQSAVGVLVGPSAIKAETRRQYRVRPLAELPDVRGRFYAISVESKLKHPAVVVISEAAGGKLFT